jgi:hypothetical protein
MRDSLSKQHAVVPFVECPNCKVLAECGAERCSRCREELDPEYALVSAAVVHYNTQACAVANTLKGLDTFAYIALPLSALIYGIDVYAFGEPALSYFVLAWPLIPLVFTLVWFNRFGFFKAGDGEFMQARRDMRGSSMLWLAILAVQALGLLLIRG